jgi:zinc and cadmium transporter
MNGWPLLAVYCVLIAGASLTGGWMLRWWRLSHTALQVLLSGVGGFMLGVAVLHLFPHGVMQSRQTLDWNLGWLLGGIVAMFFLIRMFHVHQHAVLEPEDHAANTHGHTAPKACAHDHHDHHHHPATDVHHPRFEWLGLAFGLALHTLLDGFALGAAVAAGFSESFAIFLAVFLHKPLDALSISSTMSAGGWRPAERDLANIVFALMCPAGAALFYAGAVNSSAGQALWIGTALSFSAGVFLCVALADILPELSFHSHDRFLLSAALLIGIAVAYLVGYFEPSHFHPPLHRDPPGERLGLLTREGHVRLDDR